MHSRNNKHSHITGVEIGPIIINQNSNDKASNMKSHDISTTARKHQVVALSAANLIMSSAQNRSLRTWSDSETQPKFIPTMQTNLYGDADKRVLRSRRTRVLGCRRTCISKQTSLYCDEHGLLLQCKNKEEQTLTSR